MQGACGWVGGWRIGQILSGIERIQRLVVVEFTSVVIEVNSTNRTEGSAEGRNNLEVYVHQEMLRIIRNDCFKLKSIFDPRLLSTPHLLLRSCVRDHNPDRGRG